MPLVRPLIDTQWNLNQSAQCHSWSLLSPLRKKKQTIFHFSFTLIHNCIEISYGQPSPHKRTCNGVKRSPRRSFTSSHWRTIKSNEHPWSIDRLRKTKTLMTFCFWNNTSRSIPFPSFQNKHRALANPLAGRVISKLYPNLLTRDFIFIQSTFISNKKKNYDLALMPTGHELP